ncbi:TPA: hypothetical protein DDW35_07790 [Candidatus Sumerlaeota bacterium]|nr:hypothetical protein [Candidatus Sumerlaeota bacterium]
MDLSGWLEPRAGFVPASLNWVELGPESEMARNLIERMPQTAASFLRLERCLGADDATQQSTRPDTLGVYCLTLGENQSVLGMESWTAESTPPEGRDEMLVCVRAIQPRELAVVEAEECPSGLDLLNEDAARVVLDALVAWRAAEEERRNDSFLRVSFAALRGGRRGDVSCSPGLLDFYRENWNEDPIPLLPYLWLDGPVAERFRWRYRSLIAERFRAVFLVPLSTWCQNEQLRLVLRLEPDDSLLAQTIDGLGPVMRFYEWARVPAAGQTESPNSEAVEFRLRQSDSVVAQLHVAAEDLGRTPESPDSPACPAFDNKQASLGAWRAEAERRLALGAGFLELPQTVEFLRGNGKRLGGALLFHEAQPWWEDFAALKQCLGRQSQLLAQGRRVTNVLVLVPSDSILALAANPMPENMAGLAAKASEFNKPAREIERQFQNLLVALEAYQIDHDLGDEDLIERHGNAEANSFVIGEREYTALVIPPALTWRKETLKKVWRFARKGGSVVIARPFAEQMDLETSQALERLSEEFANVYIVERSGREVCFQVSRLAPPPLQVKSVNDQSADGLLVRHRRTLTHEVFHVINTLPDRDIDAKVTVQAAGAVRVLDPWTPHILSRETDVEKKMQTFPFIFHAGASTLFAIGGESDLTEPPYQRMPHATSAEPLESKWRFERIGPNLMPLRQCRWKTGEDGHSRVMPVDFSRVEIAQKLSGQEPERVSLTFDFESSMEGAEELGVRIGLAVEFNEGQTVRFNGEQVPQEQAETLFDLELRLLDVTGLLREGANRVEISFPWSADAVVEMPLLAGDFAVMPNQVGTLVLREEAAFLRDGDLVTQGYPFFAGRMKLWRDFKMTHEERKRYFIRLDKPASSVVAARVGNHESAPLYSHPHRLEVTRLARDGENRLEIEIASSLYNVFGPVHLSPKLIRSNMPLENWDAVPSRDRRLWNPKPTLQPFGLLGGVLLETFDPDVVPPPPTKKAKAEEEVESNDLLTALPVAAAEAVVVEESASEAPVESIEENSLEEAQEEQTMKSHDDDELDEEMEGDDVEVDEDDDEEDDEEYDEDEDEYDEEEDDDENDEEDGADDDE